MICPKWLVQSSAIGAFSAVLIAVPLWMSSNDGEQAPTPTVESTAVYQVEYSNQAVTSSAVLRAQEHTGQAQQEARQVVEQAGVYHMRYYLIESYQGPTCPVRLKQQPSEALHEARSHIEESTRQARELHEREVAPKQEDAPPRDALLR